METIAPDLLAKIYPLNRLPKEAVEKLMPVMRLRWYNAGAELFGIGSAPSDHYYLVQGGVALVDRTGVAQAVGPDQPIPLPHVLPSIHRASAVSGCKALLVDRQRLMDMLRRYLPGSAQSMEWAYRSAAPKPGRAELAADDPSLAPWQNAFLKAPGFRRIAVNDLRRTFELMKPVTYRAGDIVIREGDPADSFHVIAEGRCEVLRALTRGETAARVAEYGQGATLGEDGLVSGKLRNATVRMVTDGKLMRLEGDDFHFLIKRALLHGVDAAEARQMVARGSRWLDVRVPEERQVELPGSINIPHPLVRGRLFTADPQQSYVVVCAKGFDSSAVAFTLSKYGYDAYYVKGGIVELERNAPPG